MSEITKTIYIKQLLFEEWYGKIDIADAAIVSYIHNWEINGNGERDPKDDRYVWIDFKTLLECNPLLPFGYEMLRKRITKLVKLKIIFKKNQRWSDGRTVALFRTFLGAK